MHLTKLHSPTISASSLLPPVMGDDNLPCEVAAIFEEVAKCAKRYKWQVKIVAMDFPPGDEMKCHIPAGKMVYFMQLGRGMMDECTSEWIEFEIANNFICVNNEVTLNLCDPKSLNELKGLIQFYD